MACKRAIVIGASSGIGLEVAKLLIKDGWQVGVAARRMELMQGIGAVAIERIDVTAYSCHRLALPYLDCHLAQNPTLSVAQTQIVM